MPRVSPWLIVGVVLLVAVLGTIGYALWLVRPLTDRSAGVIPAGMVPSLPATTEA
jgi:hypothetical protein